MNRIAGQGPISIAAAAAGSAALSLADEPVLAAALAFFALCAAVVAAALDSPVLSELVRVRAKDHRLALIAGLLDGTNPVKNAAVCRLAETFEADEP